MNGARVIEEVLMKANEIMSSEVVTVSPDTSIKELARIFRETGISGAPVVEEGEVIGIVTEVDLIARHARPDMPVYLPLLGARIPLTGNREYREALRRIMALTARDVMTEPVIAVPPDADVEEVATLMVENRINPIPVLDGGRLMGIIGHSDLVQHLQQLEDENSATVD
jgi:CBS domain-containing protein